MTASIRKYGMYLLPNFFTTSSLFFGFYAIYSAMEGSIEHSCLSIFVAMLMDTLDGRIARLTNTQSAFGAGYDSLVDLISFGIAPALLAYSWGLQDLGNCGWIISFAYVAATALRLARFNTRKIVEHENYFQGLPCTLAAGFIVSLILVVHKYDIFGLMSLILISILLSIITTLMVSNIRFSSFKKFDFKKNYLFVGGLAVMVILCSICFNPMLVLLGVFTSYVSSALCMALYRFVRVIK
jgi:CDP-diacylglycerol---serine O-phosphatidyltransferase